MDIDRDGWPHLGAAVTFEQVFMKFGLELARGLALKLFSPGNGIPQVPEVFRLALFDVGVVKGRCAYEHCSFFRPGQLAHAFGVHRVWMVDRREARKKREPDGSRIAEGMEKGQSPKDGVLARDLEYLLEPFYVGDYIVMGEHDAFGLSCRPAREDDSRQRVGVKLPVAGERRK